MNAKPDTDARTGSESGMFSIAEAAEFAGVHYNTIYKLVRSGELPARRFGTAWRIPKDALKGRTFDEAA